MHMRVGDAGDRTGVGQVETGWDHRRASARTSGSARSGLPQISGSSKASARCRRCATYARAALTVSTFDVVPSSRAAAASWEPVIHQPACDGWPELIDETPRDRPVLADV